MTKRTNIKQHPGAITIVLVLAVTGIVLTALLSMSVIATSQIGQVRDVTESDQTFFAAEGGIHHGLHRLISNAVPGSYTITLNGAEVDVDIALDPADVSGKRRIVTSTARLAGKVRTLTITSQTSSIGGHLTAYALQSGNGGIELDNNSEIYGNLFSNGSVVGKNKNAITIFGDVWSACAPADRPACPSSLIEGVTIGTAGNPFNSHAAHYNSVVVTPPGVQTTTSSIDPTDYLFTPQMVAEFKDVADNNTLPPGNVTINGDTTLDTQKIQGSLTINSGTLTLTGPVWVTGVIDMKPGITIRLPAAAGENSGVLMSDQLVNVENNAVLMGSGNAKSFLLIISFKVDITNPTIIAANSSTAVIYFAPDGLIEVRPAQGGGRVNNVTGQKIHLKNNAQVQFDSNLSGFAIPVGPPVPIAPISGSWKEV